MKVHTLKTIQPYFNDIISQRKNFELRQNDREFQEGDLLCLQEYDDKFHTYSGLVAHRKVSYILEGGIYGLEEGYCVMGLELVPPQTK